VCYLPELGMMELMGMFDRSLSKNCTYSRCRYYSDAYGCGLDGSYGTRPCDIAPEKQHIQKMTEIEYHDFTCTNCGTVGKIKITVNIRPGKVETHGFFQCFQCNNIYEY